MVQDLREHKPTFAMWETLGEEQEGHDILTVPAQFGLRHGGRSVHRVREVLDRGDFGLGAFAVGIMLLTHPKRLQHYNDLWIDCAGDEYDDPDGDGRFSRSPCFDFDGGQVKFGARWFVNADDDCGSASAFVL